MSKAAFVVQVKNASYHTFWEGQFDNHHDGYQRFLEILSSLNEERNYRIQVAVECTGPYHLAFVRFLKEQGIEVFAY